MYSLSHLYIISVDADVQLASSMLLSYFTMMTRQLNHVCVLGVCMHSCRHGAVNVALSHMVGICNQGFGVGLWSCVPADGYRGSFVCWGQKRDSSFKGDMKAFILSKASITLLSLRCSFIIKLSFAYVSLLK